MVIFLLFKAKSVRNPTVDHFIPGQPAALRRAMFEHTPDAHPRLLYLTLPKCCCLQEMLLSRDRKEIKKKTVSKDWKSCYMLN